MITHIIPVSGTLSCPCIHLCFSLQWLILTGSHCFLLFQLHGYSPAFAAVNRECIVHCGVFKNQLLTSGTRMKIEQGGTVTFMHELCAYYITWHQAITSTASSHWLLIFPIVSRGLNNENTVFRAQAERH